MRLYWKTFNIGGNISTVKLPFWETLKHNLHVHLDTQGGNFSHIKHNSILLWVWKILYYIPTTTYSVNKNPLSIIRINYNHTHKPHKEKLTQVSNILKDAFTNILDKALSSNSLQCKHTKAIVRDYNTSLLIFLLMWDYKFTTPNRN